MKTHKNIFHANHNNTDAVIKILYKLQSKSKYKILYNKIFDKLIDKVSTIIFQINLNKHNVKKNFIILTNSQMQLI